MSSAATVPSRPTGPAASRSLIDINRDTGSYDHVYALLNVGANTTDLSIVRRGLLSFTRPVPLAGDNITNAIAEGLGYEFHEAERVKLEQGTLFVQGAPALEAPRAPAPEPQPGVEPVFRIGDEDKAPKAAQVFDLGAEAGPTASPQPPRQEPGLPVLRTPGAGTSGRQVYESMLPTLVELVTEIRRSIEYYSNRYPDSRVDTIMLYGGTACLPNFAEFLAGEVGTPVEVGNPFLRVEVDPGLPHDFVEQNAPYMPIVVGLAIRDMIE